MSLTGLQLAWVQFTPGLISLTVAESSGWVGGCWTVVSYCSRFWVMLSAVDPPIYGYPPIQTFLEGFTFFCWGGGGAFDGLGARWGGGGEGGEKLATVIMAQQPTKQKLSILKEKKISQKLTNLSSESPRPLKKNPKKQNKKKTYHPPIHRWPFAVTRRPHVASWIDGGLRTRDKSKMSWTTPGNNNPAVVSYGSVWSSVGNGKLSSV